MSTYRWDEIECEVFEFFDGTVKDDRDGWTLTKVHSNGVHEYRSDRGHVALETEAGDSVDAGHKFWTVSDLYRDFTVEQ